MCRSDNRTVKSARAHINGEARLIVLDSADEGFNMHNRAQEVIGSKNKKLCNHNTFFSTELTPVRKGVNYGFK